MANALREEVAAAERRLEEERSSHASARHRSIASPCFHQAPLHSCPHLLDAHLHHISSSSTLDNQQMHTHLCVRLLTLHSARCAH